MPWLTTTSKAVGQRFAGHRTCFSPLKNFGFISRKNGKSENYVFLRYLNSIAYSTSYSLFHQVCDRSHSRSACLGSGDLCNPQYKQDFSFIQRRGFLGCGDGEEGSMVAKVHEQRRVLGYSPEQLFAVVAAVDLYEGFIPWCQRSKILRRYPDGNFDAELQIGFKFLVESYVSHVELKKPNYIKTTASESGLFDHLINIWEFSPGPIPGTCNLHFLVDFKFKSPFYRQIANMFFKEVVSRLVDSFNDRCRLIYGPGVQVLENFHEQ